MKHISLRTYEVQNIIVGRQTRLSRPVKPQPSSLATEFSFNPRSWPKKPWGARFKYPSEPDRYEITDAYKCPFGKVGDVIAAKETYQYIDFMGEDNGYVYKESQNGKDWEENSEGWTWRSPVTMPLSACRLWLRIKEIRCERIQDISQEDIVAEGIETMEGFMSELCIWRDSVFGIHRTRKTFFKDRHNSIYGPESWDLNPWFWIIIFEKTDKPE